MFISWVQFAFNNVVLVTSFLALPPFDSEYFDINVKAPGMVEILLYTFATSGLPFALASMTITSDTSIGVESHTCSDANIIMMKELPSGFFLKAPLHQSSS